MKQNAKAGHNTAKKLAAIQAQIDKFAARTGIVVVRNKVSRRVAAKPASVEVTHDSAITFRIPSKWKANIEKQLEGMGLPKRQHAEFFRGAIIASLAMTARAKNPAWQAFLEEVQPIAQEKLGMKLTDEGLAAILRQGTILPGTPD